MGLLKFSKYIPRIFYKRGMPLNLIYFVTSKCNARCRHCFYWRKLNTDVEELDLEAIEKVARSIPDLLALSLTGGEPFLRSDLAEIASLFSRFTKVANIQIPSNGILTDSIFRTTKEILKKCHKDIRIVVGISIDDFATEHDTIREVEGCFQKAVETIKQLKSLEDKFLNFRVGDPITITKANQERVSCLVDFLRDELSIKETGVNIIRSEVKDMSLKDLNIKYYDEVMLKLREEFLNRLNEQKPSWAERVLSARQYRGSRILSKIYSQNKYITPCYAGSLLAIMREDGDIYPCEMLDEKMGNVKDFDFSFKKLWFSGKAEEIRSKIKKQRCFCTYECAMTLNTLFNFRHLSFILIDSLSKRKDLCKL